MSDVGCSYQRSYLFYAQFCCFFCFLKLFQFQQTKNSIGNSILILINCYRLSIQSRSLFNFIQLHCMISLHFQNKRLLSFLYLQQYTRFLCIVLLCKELEDRFTFFKHPFPRKAYCFSQLYLNLNIIRLIIICNLRPQYCLTTLTIQQCLVEFKYLHKGKSPVHISRSIFRVCAYGFTICLDGRHIVFILIKFVSFVFEPKRILILQISAQLFVRFPLWHWRFFFKRISRSQPRIFPRCELYFLTRRFPYRYFFIYLLIHLSKYRIFILFYLSYHWFLLLLQFHSFVLFLLLFFQQLNCNFLLFIPNRFLIYNSFYLWSNYLRTKYQIQCILFFFKFLLLEYLSLFCLKSHEFLSSFPLILVFQFVFLDLRLLNLCLRSHLTLFSPCLQLCERNVRNQQLTPLQIWILLLQVRMKDTFSQDEFVLFRLVIHLMKKIEAMLTLTTRCSEDQIRYKNVYLVHRYV